MIRRLIASWNQLNRYHKAQHLFRIEMGILLIMVGVVTYNAPAATGTFKAVQEGFPFGLNGFGLFTLLSGIFLILYRKPGVLVFFALTLPFVLFTIFNIQAVILGYTPSLYLAVVNIVLAAFMLTVYWGYTE